MTDGLLNTATPSSTIPDVNGSVTLVSLSPPTTISGTPPADTLGVPYQTVASFPNFGFTVDGAPAPTFNTTVTTGALPGGLSLNANGTITGTPTATGTFTFTVTATNTQGMVTSGTESITINSVATFSPVAQGCTGATEFAAYTPQTITTSGGTGNKALSVVENTHVVGLTVPSSGTNSLMVSGTPTATGTESFTITATDQAGGISTATYTIVVSAPATFSPAAGALPGATEFHAYTPQSITTSGGTCSKALSVVVNTAVAGLVVPSSGTNSLMVSGTPTATGTESFTITATDQAGAISTATYTILVSAPATFSPPAGALPADTQNIAYTPQTITASGGTGNNALSVVENTHVAGFTVPSSGTNSLTVSGTPTAAGTETFTVTATDQAGGISTATYTIQVNAAVTLSPTTLPADTINVAYNKTITAHNGTGTLNLTVVETSNVPGFIIPSSGTTSIAITGTPTATGTETFTVTATDSLGSTTNTTYNIVVGTLSLSPGTLPDDTIHVPYSQSISASGGSGTVTLAVSETNHVAGFIIPSSGTTSINITGTQTATGTEMFTVTATDSLRHQGAVPLTASTLTRP